MFMKTPVVRFHPHALAVLTLLLLISHPAGADFHVTLNGLDGNSGSAAKPFATLERARNAVRELIQAGKLPKDGLTVWLHGGDYVRTHAFDLTAADSGPAAAPRGGNAMRKIPFAGDSAGVTPESRWPPTGLSKGGDFENARA